MTPKVTMTKAQMLGSPALGIDGKAAGRVLLECGLPAGP